MLQRGFFEIASKGEWESGTFVWILLSEESTYIADVNDRVVSELIPGDNELVNADYERVVVAATWGWSSGVATLSVGGASAGNLDSEHTDHGISAMCLAALSGDGSDDTLNLLIGTWAVSEVLTGEEVALGGGSWAATEVP